MVLFQFHRGNFIVSDVVFFQIIQEQNTDDGWNEHHHRNHTSLAEIRHTSEHLCIQYTCDHLIFSTYRSRDSEIRKAEEKGLDKCCRKGSEQRLKYRYVKGLQCPITHQP